jgi:5-methylcytosine-specific restriction endonuclease McrA
LKSCTGRHQKQRSKTVDEKKVLVLNQSEEIIDVRPVRRAVGLMTKGKARAPHNFDDFHDVSTPDGVMKVPTALVMAYYVRIPHRHVPCTKINILRRDGYECQYCGQRLTNATGTIDHVVPISKGGKHSWSNVVTSCVKCNNKKDNKTPDEAKMKLRCQPYVPRHDMTAIHAISKHRSWKRWMIT